MSKSLQEITNAWGNWMSAKYNGNGMKFTESTNYSNRGELNQYHKYQTNATFQTMAYDPNPTLPDPGTISSTTLTFTNATNVNQQQMFNETVTTTTEFTWSITESLSIGVEIDADVDVAEVVKVGEKLTTNLSFSSTQGSTKTSSREWGEETTLTVEPQSILTATLVVETQQYDISWSATTKLSGYVAIWFNNKVALNPGGSLHWLWFIPIQSVFQQCISNNLIDTSGYKFVFDGVLAYASGTLSGGQGVGANINLESTPLGNASETSSNAQETLASAISSYVIPLLSAGAGNFENTVIALFSGADPD